MSVDHPYTPPRTSDVAVIPDGVTSYLNGSDLLSKSQAVRLATVDEDGWPHASLLSAGDMLVLTAQHIRFVVYPESGLTANLTRDGRVGLTLSLDGGMCELRMRARRLEQSADIPQAMFEAAIEQVREHAAPYAVLTSGVTFALHEPDAVLERWERQMAAMRAAG